MQENSEPGLHHSKKGRECKKGKWEQDSKVYVLACTPQLKTHFYPLILIQKLLYYTVFCEPKEL
jgi:hypothetical protein